MEHDFTPQGIAEQMAVCEAATPGPWRWENNLLLTTHKTHLVLKPFYDEDRGAINTVCDSLDKKFIAATRTAYPAALAEILRLQAEIERLMASQAEKTAYNAKRRPTGNR